MVCRKEEEKGERQKIDGGIYPRATERGVRERVVNPRYERGAAAFLLSLSLFINRTRGSETERNRPLRHRNERRQRDKEK